MKIRTLLLMFIFSFVNTFAQEENIILFQSINNELICDISYIDENNSYVFMLDERKLPYNNYNLMDYFYNSRQKVFMSNINLNLIDSIEIKAVDGFKILLKQIHQVQNDTIIIHGVAYDTIASDMQIAFIWLDYDLNILKDTLYGFKNIEEMPARVIVNQSNNLVIHGIFNPYYTKSDSKTNKYFLMEINTGGDQIQYVYDTLSMLGAGITPLGSSGRYLTKVNNNTWNRINSDFSIDTSFQLVLNNTSIWFMYPFIENQILVYATYFQGLNPINPSILDFDLMTIILDKNVNLVNSIVFGTPDTCDMVDEIGFIHPDTLFVGGTKHVMNGPVDNWMMLRKMGFNGEVLFELYYGGYGKYSLNNVLPTNDGGCLITGTWWDFYNYPDTLQQYDAVIIKVDANGLITGTYKPQLPFEVTDILVYPNPGDDYLMVNSAKENLTFKLFDLTGKEILNSGFDKNIRIETSNLIPQTYIYSISKYGIEIKSGKWVKK
ncbi:MAG: T9SS type A sorting domain-containing protein [Bacteroidales bacterium]